MKSNSTLRVVENNSYASKDFTIQASGKMFHMVISGLYSNKPQSITREIWSNAFDAHAMVGKENVPFEVTFPTALTPVFTCRDFGPGIAHEDMEGFYTVLGHSTKEDTNKAVGKWGVGRMSPMSYTDTFSVVSRHKGMKAHYTVMLGPDGSPQLHVLAPPMPTDEADGLEVSFPVNRMDIGKFQTAADIVAYGFDVKPVVINSKEKQFKEIKKVFEGTNFYLYEGDYRMQGAYAQMGCVLYPIPRDHLPRSINAVYQFDIGDLEVTASREALSFGPNDPTAASVKKMAERVEKELWDTMQKRVDEQPTLFKAAQIAPSLRRYLPHQSPQFKYKGKDIPKYWKLEPVLNIACVGYLGHRQSQAGWNYDDSISCLENYRIFVQDMSDKKSNARAAMRIAKYIKDKADTNHFIWVRADLSDARCVAEVKAMQDTFGYELHYIKDLPDVVLPPRGKRKIRVSTINTHERRVPFDMDDTAFTTGGHYYAMSNNDYPSWVLPVAKAANTMGIRQVILVPKTLWKKFKEAPQWVPLEPAVEDFLARHKADVLKKFSHRYDTHPYTKLRFFAGKGCGPVSDFADKTLVKSPEDHLNVSRHVWERLFSAFKLGGLSGNSAGGEYENLLAKYPLLKYVDNYGAKPDDFVEYIKAMNKE